MAGVIATIPRLRLTDGSGAPLIGGSVTVYAAGTTTLENSWQDRNLTILNNNPIILDGLGSCVVWLDSLKTYKIAVKDALGATVWTQDNISGGGVDSSFELSTAAIQAALTEAIGYRDEALEARDAALAALAAAQLIASGSLVLKEEKTGAGPWTLTDPLAVSIVGVLVNGQEVRLSKFTLTNSGKTATNTGFPTASAPFISSTAEVDLLYVRA